MITLFPSGDPQTDTRSLQQAVANHSHVVLEQAPGAYSSFQINDTIRITRSGTKVSGINPWSTCVIWVGESHKPMFEITGAQYVTVTNMLLQSSDWQAPRGAGAAWGIRVSQNGDVVSSFAHVENVWIQGAQNGIHIQSGVEHRLSRVQLRALTGTKGVHITGTVQHPQYRCIISDIVCDMGEHENRQVDWITLDSYAYSLRIDGAALLNGRRGLIMMDSQNVGNSYPTWVLANDLETDHTDESGVWLEAGEGFYAGESWFGSSLKGDGVTTTGAWRGDLSITSSRIFGNVGHGVRLDAGVGASMVALTVADNNAGAKPGQRGHGIWVGDQTVATQIGDCHLGDAVGVKGNNQCYGLWIQPNAQQVRYSNITHSGNTEGGIKDMRSWWTKWRT